jgi:hypothetical protein
VAQGLLDPNDLRRILDEQQALPPDEPVRRLGSLLIRSGQLTMRQVAEALAQQRGGQASSGQAQVMPNEVRGLFPLEVLSEIGAAPLCLVGRTVAVAMVDAHNPEHVARLQALTDRTVRPMVAPQIQVQRLLQSVSSTASLRPSARSAASAPARSTASAPPRSTVSPPQRSAASSPPRSAATPRPSRSSSPPSQMGGVVELDSAEAADALSFLEGVVRPAVQKPRPAPRPARPAPAQERRPLRPALLVLLMLALLGLGISLGLRIQQRQFTKIGLQPPTP